mmetsp:Transcript_7049/g.13328  ORF Transcript_7049/g.13328 Transcript_7049/m.13328 type:complete len:160 (+) Transcript_7049:31-510(+)
MVFCSTCGNGLNDTDVFCNQCGAKVTKIALQTYGDVLPAVQMSTVGTTSHQAPPNAEMADAANQKEDAVFRAAASRAHGTDYCCYVTRKMFEEDDDCAVCGVLVDGLAAVFFPFMCPFGACRGCCRTNCDGNCPVETWNSTCEMSIGMSTILLCSDWSC